MEKNNPFLSFHQKQEASYSFKRIWNPSWFEENRQKKNYFEGWYFKSVSENGGHSMAFIPGISIMEPTATHLCRPLMAKPVRRGTSAIRSKPFNIPAKVSLLQWVQTFFQKRDLN